MTRFQRFLTALSCTFFCATLGAETVVPAQDGIVLHLVSRLDDFGAYATSVQLPRPINFGIVAFTRPSPNEAVVEATIQSLRRSFGEENVRVREYTMTELAQAIRDEEVDIFLSSAGFYCRSRRPAQSRF